MFNPIRLVDDNFEDKNLSDADLRSFTEDFLIRLANPDNNPGAIYSGLITDTTTKYNSYYGKITSQATKKALAEGTTITRNNARKAAENKIDSLQGLVKFKFGENSAVYQQFYPLGLTEYTRAKEGDIGTLFDRFVTAASTNLTADYPAEVTAISDLVTAFHNAYTARETVVSEVDTVTTGKHEDRKALTVQLTIDFLTIAINNIDNPDKFDDYYDASFLPLSGDNGIRTGNVAGGQVANIPVSALTINADTGINLKNTGPAALRFYFGAAADAQPGATFIDVPFTGELDTTAAALGFADGTNVFFLVKNMEAPAGSFRVEIG